MAKTSSTAPKLDHFFSAVAARLDLWRDLARAAQSWASNAASRGDAALQAACNEALTGLMPLEDFQAYPGAKVMSAIKQRASSGDAMDTVTFGFRQNVAANDALRTGAYSKALTFTLSTNEP